MTEPRRGRGRPPQVPPAPREPIGRDRVASGGPRRTPRTRQGPERPQFPPDAEIELPVRVRKEIDRIVHDRNRSNEVKLALSLGAEASEQEDHAAARRYLLWAKHLAPRATVVRETLGIALYRAGDLRAALSELQNYRRLSGSDDQNHLLADCLRAEGRDLTRAVEIGMALVTDVDADVERRVEAAIVVAAIHLDLGAPARARAVLVPFLEGADAAAVPEGSTVRLLWVLADVAEADGRAAEAVAALERLRSIDAEYPDVDERLTGLRGDAGR